MERINGEGILLNGFMVFMINVVIFNNFGIGIWNVYIDKEVKFLRYIISFKIIFICLYCRGKILIMYFLKFL